MKFNKIILAVALSVPVAGLTTGCLKTVNSPSQPIAANQFYGHAALILNDFSGILVQAQQLFTSAHQIGVVSDSDYLNGQKTFVAIASSADGIVTLIKAGADQKTITTQINALVTQIGTMPAAFAIKNPASQAEFTALVTAMQNVLNASLTLVNQ